jgi:hypothetical protein
MFYKLVSCNFMFSVIGLCSINLCYATLYKLYVLLCKFYIGSIVFCSAILYMLYILLCNFYIDAIVFCSTVLHRCYTVRFCNFIQVI